MLKDFFLKKALFILLLLAVVVAILWTGRSGPTSHFKGTTNTARLSQEEILKLPLLAEDYLKEVDLSLSKSPPILNLLSLNPDQ